MLVDGSHAVNRFVVRGVNQTIRLESRDERLNTRARLFRIYIVASGHFGHYFVHSLSSFQGLPNQKRGFIQLVVPLGLKIHQNTLTAIELSANYLVLWNGYFSQTSFSSEKT